MPSAAKSARSDATAALMAAPSMPVAPLRSSGSGASAALGSEGAAESAPCPSGAAAFLAASKLQEREYEQQNVFAPGGAPLVGGDGDATEKPLGDVGLFDLLTAFNEVLANAPVEPLGEIEPVLWTVPDKIDMILGVLRHSEGVAFSRLFTPKSPRGEIIVTFLALLELLRLRQVAVSQPEPFTEIIVSKVAEGTGEADLPPPVIGGADHA